MENKDFHFSIGHFCAGCPVSNFFHTGCVRDGSVVIRKESGKSAHVDAVEQSELFATAFEPSQKLFQD